MFKKLFSKLFKKTESNKANLYYFEESRKALTPKDESHYQQPIASHKAVTFRSFEDQYQQAFYDYLLGPSDNLGTASSDELTTFISEKIQSLLNSPKLILDALPVLPLSLTKIIEQLNNQDFETDTLIQLIQQEPAIAAKVIELANSAYYNRHNKEITDLKSAFTVLGVKGLLEGVINGFVNKLVPQSNIYFRQYGQKIWPKNMAAQFIYRYNCKSNSG